MIAMSPRHRDMVKAGCFPRGACEARLSRGKTSSSLRAGDVEAEFLRTYARDLIAKGPDIFAAGRLSQPCDGRAGPCRLCSWLWKILLGGGWVPSRGKQGGKTPRLPQLNFVLCAKGLW